MGPYDRALLKKPSKEPSKRALKTSLTAEPYKWGPTTEPC